MWLISWKHLLLSSSSTYAQNYCRKNQNKIKSVMVAKGFRWGIKSVCALSAPKFATFVCMTTVYVVGKSKTFIQFVSHFWRSVHRRVIVTNYCFVPLVTILFFYLQVSTPFALRNDFKRSTLPNLRIKIVQFWI